MPLPLILAFLQAPMPPRTFRFKVAPDAIQHLGEVGPREARSLRFTITNISGKPLAFRLSGNSPGTAMDDGPLKAPFAPGESRSLEMRVDPAGSAGYQRRAIRMAPDDPAEPSFVFRADMTVRPDLTVDAARKSLGAVAPHESPEAVFVFKRETGEPLELKLESAPSPYLDAAVEAQGAKGALRVVLRPSKLRHGQAAGLEILKVAANAPLQRSFTLYLDWKLKRSVEAVPARLVFDQAEERFQSIELRSDRPFAIESIAFDEAALSLASQTQGQAKEHRLTFCRKVSKAPAGALRIRIQGAEEPIEIPVLLRLP